MQNTVFVKSKEELISLCNAADSDIYVFGNQQNARLIFSFLGDNNIEPLGLVVSVKPEKNTGQIPVYGLVEIAERKTTIVVATTIKHYDSILDAIGRTEAVSVLMLSPFIYENIMAERPNKNVNISPRAFVAEDVFIYADESSQVIIDDYVVIHPGCRIKAVNRNTVHIYRECQIEKNGEVIASKNSEISLYDNTKINRDCIMKAVESAVLSVGKNGLIGSHAYMVAKSSKIILADNCLLSHYVKMNTGSHNIMRMSDDTDIMDRSPILIDEGVWIGMGSCMLAKAHVGAGSIVGANAVVNSEINPNTICVGSPAREVKSGIYWHR